MCIAACGLSMVMRDGVADMVVGEPDACDGAAEAELKVRSRVWTVRQLAFVEADEELAQLQRPSMPRFWAASSKEILSTSNELRSTGCRHSFPLCAFILMGPRLRLTKSTTHSMKSSFAMAAVSSISIKPADVAGDCNRCFAEMHSYLVMSRTSAHCSPALPIGDEK